jgi:outer membrane protein assembly factor BamA
MAPPGRCAILLLVAACSAASPAGTIRSLSLTGNRAFTARELGDVIALRPGALFTPAALQNDLQSITDMYRAEGYLAASASASEVQYSSDSSRVDLSLAVVEGRRTVVGTMAFEGNTVLSDADIRSSFDVVPGRPLDEAALERDIDALLGKYELAGYPFARCTVGDVARRPGESEDSADVTLRVVEGVRMTIDEIRVRGNRETEASVIIRETRLEPGETYNPAKINAIRQRLNRLNIFSSVAEPELYLRGRAGGLLITVQEGNTSTFDGILGYLPPSSSGGPGTLTGLASVSMRNLFGTGRKLSLKWQREDRSSQEIGVRYVEPWVLGAPVNLGVGFLQRQQDSSYVRRSFDAKVELMFSEELSVGVVFNSERVIPSGDSTTARVIGTTSTTGGIEIQYDSRDDLTSPTSGARYGTDYHYGRKTVGAIPPLLAGRAVTGGTLQQIGIDCDFFVTTFRRQVVAFGLHGREIRTGQPQESDMFRFGGTNTMRGYRENQFLGSRIAWTNTEYRFLLARRSFVYGFIDTGYFFRPADDLRGTPSAEAFRYGYGIGVRLDTPLGNVGVSIAFGQGDTFGTAKIHFGLINDF